MKKGSGRGSDFQYKLFMNLEERNRQKEHAERRKLKEGFLPL